MPSVVSQSTRRRQKTQRCSASVSWLMLATLLSFVCGFFVCNLASQATANQFLFASLDTDLAANKERSRTADSSLPLRSDQQQQQQQQQLDWPSKAVSEPGNPLVKLGTNFVDQSRELFLQYFDEFMEIYQNRPDKVNICGIRINHAYALFLAVKVLQPTTVIESGVNAGLSTYIIRSAAPTKDTKIYPIDPEDKPICGQKERWIDTVNSQYYTGKENFQDIQAIDWKSKIDSGEVDPERTLVFLDDHRNVYDRFAMIFYHGFRHVVLEDNYRLGEGVTQHDRSGWTMKQMFAKRTPDSEYLAANLRSYAEFPPLFPSIMARQYNKTPRKKVGGFMYHTDQNTDVVPPLFRPDINTDDLQMYNKIAAILGVDPDLKDNESYMQFMNYNQICYIETRPYSPRLRSKIILKQ